MGLVAYYYFIVSATHGAGAVIFFNILSVPSEFVSINTFKEFYSR